MSHTFLMLLAFVLCIALCNCEVVPLGTTAKLKALQKAHYSKKRSTHHRKAASQDTMYVSPAWLQEYHEMEAEQGGYTIADDAKIQHDGDKVKVPRTVLKHFHDLSKTPPKTEEQQ